MNNSELCSMIEAILFAAGEPVPFERLCRGAACEPMELAAALDDLAGMYSFDRRGIRLVRVNDTAQLATAPEYAEQVRAALEMRRAPALSQPSLEVLAIIAANQPTTRAYIEQVRGVDSSYTVGVLMEKGIVEEAGRLDVPGRPMLLRTTPEFLRIFGVSSYAELAELPEIRALRAEEPKPAGDESPEGQHEAGQGLPVPADAAAAATAGERPADAEAYEPEELTEQCPVEAEERHPAEMEEPKTGEPSLTVQMTAFSSARGAQDADMDAAAGGRDGEST